MTKPKKLLLGLIGFVFLAVVIVSFNQYQAEQQRKTSEAEQLLKQGIDQFGQNQFESALQTFQSIPEDTIQDWRIPYFQGRALIQLKKYKAAAEVLEQAFGMNDRAEGIPFALGVVYFKLGNLSLSKSYFHAVLEINPANEEAKGLMDKMANLERNQPGDLAPGTHLENAGAPKVHSKLPAALSPEADKTDEGT